MHVYSLFNKVYIMFRVYSIISYNQSEIFLKAILSRKISSNIVSIYELSAVRIYKCYVKTKVKRSHMSL